MSYMFYLATTFNQPIGDWDVSRVTNMDFMFYDTAFNKSIQTELEKRISRKNVETKTFHSIGLRAITQKFGNVEILVKSLNP